MLMPNNDHLQGAGAATLVLGALAGIGAVLKKFLPKWITQILEGRYQRDHDAAKIEKLSAATAAETATVNRKLIESSLLHMERMEKHIEAIDTEMTRVKMETVAERVRLTKIIHSLISYISTLRQSLRIAWQKAGMSQEEIDAAMPRDVMTDGLQGGNWQASIEDVQP